MVSLLLIYYDTILIFAGIVFMKPKVTIGVCVKNSESSIKEAIESILNQDYPHELMELIIVDGYSKDNTLSIIKNCLKNVNLRTKIFQENEGLGWARQIVVENANGKYIVWVDSDMILSKDFVRKQVEFMENNPSVAIAKGKLALKSTGSALATLETFSRAISKMIDFKSNARSNVLGTGGSIYRTQVIKQVGGFDKDIKGYCEDWDIELKIRKAGWLLKTMNVEYLDYERLGMTWKDLWVRYWRRGYDTHYFLHKHPGLIKHYRMFPPAAFFAGLFHAHRLFKLTKEKIVFLLPFQYVFKMVAWYIGFIKSHLNYMDHDLRSGDL